MPKSLAERTQPKLTRKQAIFVESLIQNPKESATEAAAKAYQVSNRATAQVIASENLSKPMIISALAQHNDLLERTLMDTVEEWGHSTNTRRREIAQNAVMYAHDKIHGKATQRVEQQSVSVDISIDLT